MRKLSCILVAACAALLLAGPARADGIRWSWDSLSVAAGAAISSGVQGLGSVERITCTVDNAGAVARNFTVTFFADNGTTVMFVSTAISVLAATKVAVSIAHGATAGAGVSAIPAAPSRKAQIDFAAGGAAAGRVICWGR
jgi:hypothetical protein